MNERAVLRNARLADGRVVDVHIVDGLITAVDDAVSVAAPVAGERIHDLHGRLLLPAMAEPHAHLDKALLADDMVNHTGDLDGAIEAMIGADPTLYAPDRMAARAHRALELLLVNGVTAVRSHVNVGEEIGADWASSPTCSTWPRPTTAPSICTWTRRSTSTCSRCASWPGRCATAASPAAWPPATA